jgi:hypothetical protein
MNKKNEKPYNISHEYAKHIARLKSEQPIMRLGRQFPRPLLTVGFVLTLLWSLVLLIGLWRWLFT